MSVDTLSSVLLWVIAGVVVLAAMLCALVHRWAARVVVLAVGAMLAILVFGAHQQVTGIPRNHPAELCHGGVRWFGIDLGASDEFCAAWR
jgi:hypothetical protein